MSEHADDPIPILEFWWSAGPEKWFTRDEAFDDDIRARFLGAYERAAAGAHEDWCERPHGALALILLLDQFPRNLFREDKKAFATDAEAVRIADQAVSRQFDLVFPVPHRRFFYMPFEHAEDIALQERAVDLCRIAKDQEGYFYALIHLDVIRRFGRFPHRNTVLGRASTPEEEAYLAAGGFKA